MSNDYNPVSGKGCYGERVPFDATAWDEGIVSVPAAMMADGAAARIASLHDYRRLRCRYDFEYWAMRCVVIKHKVSRRDVPFILNRPQRRVLALMEDMRLARKPVRLIMLKARQWGGSTLVQLYMAWWQTVLHTSCHSLICCHFKDASVNILGMYGKLLKNYPVELWEGESGSNSSRPSLPEFKAFERSANIRLIAGRDCRVTVASIENQDAVRSGDYAMAHLSEVAFWRDSNKRSPDDFIRAIGGSIHFGPDTLVVMESTANGTGNFFHREWLRAVNGESDKTPVFVPWYEIDIYSSPVTDSETLLASLDDYEKSLLEMGLSLEQVNWYHHKRKEYSSHSRMMAEFPTDSIEAFISSGSGVFAPELVARLREGCTAPVAVGELASAADKGPGALTGLRFVADSRGPLRVWEFPPVSQEGKVAGRFIVGVDIGGLSDKADWSVITVMDCSDSLDCKPRVVATWRGHIPHDLLAWRCAAIARWYADALLVIESNTLETEHTDGDPSSYILNEIGRHYRNLYYRTDLSGQRHAPGVHMNRATKSALVTELLAAVRESGYVERDNRACDELDTFERKSNGSTGARDGCHDDMVVSRGLVLMARRERRISPRQKITEYLAGNTPTANVTATPVGT